MIEPPKKKFNPGDVVVCVNSKSHKYLEDGRRYIVVGYEEAYLYSVSDWSVMLKSTGEGDGTIIYAYESRFVPNVPYVVVEVDEYETFVHVVNGDVKVDWMCWDDISDIECPECQSKKIGMHNHVPNVFECNGGHVFNKAQWISYKTRKNDKPARLAPDEWKWYCPLCGTPNYTREIRAVGTCHKCNIISPLEREIS